MRTVVQGAADSAPALVRGPEQHRGSRRGRVAPAAGRTYLASALSASLMPSLTPTSAGKALRAAAASLSL